MVHPGGNFQEKSNTFRGITFFTFLPKRPKFSVPFVWITSAGLQVERKRKIYWYFVNGTTQSRSCFRCQKKYQYHLTEIFHRNSVQMVSARIGKISPSPGYLSARFARQFFFFFANADFFSFFPQCGAWFRNKERRTKVKDRAKSGASKRAGRGGEQLFLSLPLPALPFFRSRSIFRASNIENPVPRYFFVPNSNGNACYAGYRISDVDDYIEAYSVQNCLASYSGFCETPEE